MGTFVMMAGLELFQLRIMQLALKAPLLKISGFHVVLLHRETKSFHWSAGNLLSHLRFIVDESVYNAWCKYLHSNVSQGPC